MPASLNDAQLKQIQEKNSEGVTVALYAHYDYGDAKTRSNNQAFFVESKRFAENQEAIGLDGNSISIGVAIPIDEVSDVIVAVQSIHQGLVAKWQQKQAGGNQSTRVFGKDAGLGTGGLHIFDLLYDETFIHSELSRLFPNNPDLAALHDSLRDQMWKHYQNKMYDFKNVVQSNGSIKKRGVPKVYKVGQHTLGQEQFVNVDGAKSTLHQDWTDVWIKAPAHLSEVKTKET